MDMSIAALSVGMHQQLASQQTDVAVLKMAMDAQTEMTADMLESIDVSAMTGIGGMVDLLA